MCNPIFAGIVLILKCCKFSSSVSAFEETMTATESENSDVDKFEDITEISPPSPECQLYNQ